MKENLLQRITLDPDKCGGRPCIRHPVLSSASSKGSLSYLKPMLDITDEDSMLDAVSTLTR